jgi:hypothetical protein
MNEAPSLIAWRPILNEGTNVLIMSLVSVNETASRSSAPKTSIGTGESDTVLGLPLAPVTTISSSMALFASCAKTSGEKPAGKSKLRAMADGSTLRVGLFRFGMYVSPLRTIFLETLLCF